MLKFLLNRYLIALTAKALSVMIINAKATSHKKLKFMSPILHYKPNQL